MCIQYIRALSLLTLISTPYIHNGVISKKKKSKWEKFRPFKVFSSGDKKFNPKITFF